jgi:hypothetical protein
MSGTATSVTRDKTAAAEFTKLWLAEMPAREIGRRFNISTTTVSDTARCLALPKRSNATRATKASATAAGRAGRLLDDLPVNACRWPIGDTKDPDFEFCGDHTKAGSPYCEMHHGKAYTRISAVQGDAA